MKHSVFQNTRYIIILKFQEKLLKKIDRISTRVAKIQPHPLTQVLTQVCAKACWKRKFAAEEKQLFRWLYLEGEQPEAYQSDILTQEVISVIVDEFGYAEDAARRFHQDMIYFTYGLAIMQARAAKS